MAIEETLYLSYTEAVLLHIELMRFWGETRYGVFDRGLVESALVRPQQAAAYEGADLIRQAATLGFGLIKDHPSVGGNKRTATAIMDEFLFRNGLELVASTDDHLEMVFAIESDRWGVDDMESWLRRHVTPKS
ncbi:MAG: type II toxin-antitoxin system death-on-curing family toxin [Candidatus Tectomicrobia bacterium]|nr:type II toxin-antitoxin system death-on-curing family toxin [Candidatus Tectomicrobia bacterium]